MPLQENDIEDLAADVFAAALRSLERFRRESSLSTWLTSITRRVVHRELDRVWRTKVVRGDLSHSDCADPTNHPPIEDMLLKENRERLEAALEKLPETLRLVLRLHYVDRLSYRAIGEQLGISSNSVGPALARGRQLLREIFKRQADSGELRMLNAFEARPKKSQERRTK